MFTGIVEEVGAVSPGERFRVLCRIVLADLAPGASIAVNGVCLTAVDVGADGFSCDLAPETIARSNLGRLRPGDRVNLERPVTLATRLSGHMVQGHVDTTGILESIKDSGDSVREILVRIPPEFDRWLVYKGSIAIDGISLTIAHVENGLLRVAIIPHTWAFTNISGRKPGDSLNVECDIIAKHLEKLLASLRLQHMT
jgi:riboflavin synthase